MKRVALLAGLLAVLMLAPAVQGKVVNEFTDVHPKCDAVSEEVEITVRGGREQAEEFNGAVFTFDQREFDVPGCARVHVTFINTDEIRHQFMVHGTFPNGFFLLEVDGPGQESGTFTVGPDPKTRLVHCGLPQHQQKGMKAQVLIAGGEEPLPNILGISGIPEEDQAKTGTDASRSIGAMAQAIPASAIGLAVAAAAGAAGGALLVRSRQD